MRHNSEMIQIRTKDIDRGKRVRKIRKDILGIRAQDALASRLGVTRGAVGNWELGGEMGIDAMAALSKLSGVPIDWIAYGKGSIAPSAVNTNTNQGLVPDSRAIDQIPISGKVAANSWHDVGDAAIDYDNVEYVPSLSGYPADWQFAYRVDGNCLNKVAKHGSVLVCLNIISAGYDIQDDDLVIVQRSRFGGQMVERTAKRVRQTSRGVELWPDSTDPSHQEPITLYETPDGTEVQIIGKVLWILNRP